jgi:uncharacterized protein (TIGR03000 family)
MYSVVLAAMLATGEVTPNCYWGGWGGCYCGWGWGGWGWGGWGGWGGSPYYGGWWGGYGWYGVDAAPTVAPASNTATVVVQVPERASLYVDGRQVTMNTNPRDFRTPSLEPGQTYYYTMKVVAVRGDKIVSQTRKVEVRANETSRVTFNDLKPEGSAKAQVTVKLPAEAKLTVQGKPCPLTSSERVLASPPLEPGKTYYYILKAELTRDGQKREETQRVAVSAGKQVTVEFKDLKVESTARR